MLDCFSSPLLHLQDGIMLQLVGSFGSMIGFSGDVRGEILRICGSVGGRFGNCSSSSILIVLAKLVIVA